MAAYVIADVTVKDQHVYDLYRREVPASLEPYGGRFVVRGGDFEVVEGDWQPRRLVIIAFPDADARRQWYDSEFYQEIAKRRWQAADTNVVFVDGL